MPRTQSLARKSLLAVALLFLAARAQAGPVFLTGHDPDFHSQDSAHAQHLLTAGLQFVTGNTMDSGQKFLWVESFLAPIGGHRVGEDGLNALGLVLGDDYDWVNAAGFAGVDLGNYDAIAIASSFGGMLTQAELDALIARSDDIKDFINGGGGLFASAECFPSSGFCDGSLLVGPDPHAFGYLPVAVTSVNTTAPYSLTPAGSLMFPTLTNDDMNDPTHNSFGLVGGLTIVDTDAAGIATTLAGNVKIGDGVFTPEVPEPGSLILLGSGVFALAARSYRKRRA